MKYTSAIIESANHFGLEPLLVAAVIWQESKGDQGAIRYESGFERRYISKKDHEALGGHWPTKDYEILFEENMRSTSHGLMQIMLQTAIDHGFTGTVAELYDVQINIHFGCKVLFDYRRAVMKANPEANGAQVKSLMLLKYNGGGNPLYPKEVFGHISSGAAAKLLGRGG